MVSSGHLLYCRSCEGFGICTTFDFPETCIRGLLKMNFFSAILYYLVIIPVSFLPFRLMYGLSDIVFVLLFHVFPYRKKIVMQNLQMAFPEKSIAELKKIRKEFYRHFCDLIFESLKTFTATREKIESRIELVNAGLLEKYFRENKSLILATGHYANWEWPALTFSSHSRHTATGIYKQLTNPYFDKKLIQTRARFGTKLMSTKEVAKFFEQHQDELCTYGFINDQSPSDPKKGYWMKFLNQDTCHLTGVEKYAVKYNYPVLYGIITKKGRGRYRMEYKVVSDNPSLTRPNEITETCVQINEEIIRKQPEYWLWTHRRWKHKRPVD